MNRRNVLRPMAMVLLVGLWATACSERGPAPDAAVLTDAASAPVLSPSTSTTPPAPAADAKQAPENPSTARHHALWASAIGGLATQASRAVATATDGSVYVAGYFEGDTEFSPSQKLSAAGASDGFVAKYSAGGDLVWVLALASPGEDSLNAIAVAAGGDVIIGGNVAGTGVLGDLTVASNGSDDALVAAISPAGAPLWVTTFGSTDSDGINALVLAGGAIIAGGSFRGAMAIAGRTLKPARTTDAFVVSLDMNGKLGQTRALGDLGEESLMSLVPHGPGGVAIVVRYTDSLTLGPHRLISAGTGTTDFAVAALDATLTPLWAVAFGNAFNNIPGGLAAMPDGDLVVSGSFDYKLELGGKTYASLGASDVFVARISPQGALRWVTACGGAGEDIIYSTAASTAGVVAATGWFEGEFTCQTKGVTSSGGKDAMLLSLDADGQAIALARFGDSDHDQGRALAPLPNQRWAIGGVFRISLNYGEKSLIQAPAVAPPRRADGFLLVTQLR
ncbi:MAG: hypothetical protein IPL79_16745 [Myxococcales bacterium]|nr:hypothetical protein [Myxococcales bacterium]